jgi:hypothetical protein
MYAKGSVQFNLQLANKTVGRCQPSLELLNIIVKAQSCADVTKVYNHLARSLKIACNEIPKCARND